MKQPLAETLIRKFSMIPPTIVNREVMVPLSVVNSIVRENVDERPGQPLAETFLKNWYELMKADAPDHFAGGEEIPSQDSFRYTGEYTFESFSSSPMAKFALLALAAQTIEGGEPQWKLDGYRCAALHRVAMTGCADCDAAAPREGGERETPQREVLPFLEKLAQSWIDTGQRGTGLRNDKYTADRMEVVKGIYEYCGKTLLDYVRYKLAAAPSDPQTLPQEKK